MESQVYRLSTMENEEAPMTPDKAAAALASIDRTHERLAQRTRWPWHRHAMFGLVEGLMVAAVAQPLAHAGAMFLAAMVLLISCILGDRRRDGMFVSGWQAGATRPLTFVILLFVLAMAVLAVGVREASEAAPIGYVLGGLTFAVCTAASLLWEKIYRTDLTGISQP
ncbi:hypothetical protein [Blastomonas sp. UPD001]|jgi:hypothetical protein|uniref:hypothetical protein n=1 Tax=Blastomonas sp. UPD001 TaxID=2217673 RepID=UPI00130088E9|nr:hypothetical protein [Blastomonas sp. UPD001]